MRLRSRLKRLVVVLSLPALIAIGVWYALHAFGRGPNDAIGIVRNTEIRVAPEVSGRLTQYMVKPGQTVERGQPLAALRNPELWAAVDEAQAQVDKARSDRDRVYAGIRPEQVAALQREISKAEAAQLLARQQYARKAELVKRSDVSVQDLDIATAEVRRAEADVEVAQARYAEAKLGPTTEERALADATVTVAEAARDVVVARAAKMLLHAPTRAVVGVLVPEVGEAIIPGEPVLTLLPDHGTWFGFNLREDALRDITIGSKVRLTPPGNAEPISATVAEMRNWGEFAVWRAARAAGDHDLNTFFLRLDPVPPASTLVAGQTVWLGAGSRAAP